MTGAITIWQMTLLITFMLFVMSLLLYTVMRKGQKSENSAFEKILEQNKFLVSQLDLLQKQVMSLNEELTLLTEENKVLNNEVSSLTKEVSRLQIQVNNIK